MFQWVFEYRESASARYGNDTRLRAYWKTPSFGTKKRNPGQALRRAIRLQRCQLPRKYLDESGQADEIEWLSAALCLASACMCEPNFCIIDSVSIIMFRLNLSRTQQIVCITRRGSSRSKSQLYPRTHLVTGTRFEGGAYHYAVRIATRLCRSYECASRPEGNRS